ncbi:rab32, member RAS oncoprotein [Lunasporangiospora selenospora]|uniref:Rab32, member RAS oncoprotein n=1 Tax=Lunasporangiospora selenospora TaxID=979761 RepID=A0A9P6FLH8_9FUNG|nr:rab32, member RAS oncoprotein [Lunasporangiospora selenospora]
MTRVYYREAVAAVVVYDVTRPKTFETVAKWKADLDQKVHLPEALGGGSIPVILLANKADNGKTNLDEEKMNQFCKEHGFLKWFGTSAKDNSNIENATQFLLSEVMTIEQENAHRVVDKATMLERVNLSQSMTRSGCC